MALIAIRTRRQLASIPLEPVPRQSLLCGLLLAMTISGPLLGADAPQPAVGTFIVGVDADVLMDSIFPRCTPVPGPPRFYRAAIQREYQANNTDEILELWLGVYAKEELASRALFSTLPSAGVRSPPKTVGKQTVSVEGFVSERACHVRLRNVFAMIRFSDNEPLSRRNEVWTSLYESLRDPLIAPLGLGVNMPGIQIVEVSRVSHKARVVEGAYNVVCRIDDEGGILFPGHGHPVAHRLDNGLYEFVIKTDAVDGYGEFRFARPTGEIGVFKLDAEQRNSVTNVMAIWEERDTIRRHKRKYGLSEAERNEIIAKLRKRVGSLDEEQKMVLRLREEGAAESVPLFLEILDSDRAAAIKQRALRGLSAVKGADGLDKYCTIAEDHDQPENVRISAVKLIGKYGTQRDVALLRSIARDEGLTLPPTYPDDDVVEQLRRDRFDAINVFLYELWSAIRLLESKPPQRTDKR